MRVDDCAARGELERQCHRRSAYRSRLQNDVTNNSGSCNGANNNRRGRHVRWGGKAKPKPCQQPFVTLLTRRGTSMTETKEAANWGGLQTKLLNRLLLAVLFHMRFGGFV